MSAGLTLILVALTSPFFLPSRARIRDLRRCKGDGDDADRKIADKDPSPHIVFALALSTAVTGVALYVLGKLKMGRWVRYIPYPVVGGFLVSTGWVLAVGGMRVMVPPTFRSTSICCRSCFSAEHLAQTLFGVGFRSRCLWCSDGRSSISRCRRC